MHFGRDSSTELGDIDFTLPPDHPVTSDTLQRKGDPSNFDLRIGSSLWGRKEWIGTLFPEKTSEKNFLTEYARKVNYIELNATFYGMPPRSRIDGWYEKAAGRDFIFAPKIPRSITHILRFKNTGERIREFLDVVSGLKEKLGPVFFQCNDNFRPDQYPLLIEALDNATSSYKTGTFTVFVELRHEEWFADPEFFDRVATDLAARNIGLVLNDTPVRRDVLHMALTVPKLFVRFNGNGDHPADENRIRNWAKRIARWKAQGLTNVYFTIHQEDIETFPVSLERVRAIFAEHSV
ncbi:DUF72 domain-containing protein [Daejeonella lutea]|uniref:Uncharacterized conserved protein YecE, DUF72 family n=1 Tax=Daejeonella lutea TaxID=572036 RepID=A0A1T5AEN5_9SPHI|nr:DUF72 domain-containing protein [Daejeonella lutea]SKB33481.1 Uncharacterized conserved protein YecE, DUF72 family [Daejeonella lutea]